MMLATLGIKILKSGHFKEPEKDIVLIWPCRIGWEWERKMISQFGKESRKYQSESKESEKKSEISEQEERDHLGQELSLVSWDEWSELMKSVSPSSRGRL